MGTDRLLIRCVRVHRAVPTGLPSSSSAHSGAGLMCPHSRPLQVPEMDSLSLVVSVCLTM